MKPALSILVLLAFAAAAFAQVSTEDYHLWRQAEWASYGHRSQAANAATDDATQARLRVNYCVFGGPNVDIYLNGEIAENGGVPQTDQGFWTNGYSFLEPGTHSVAITPTGRGLDQALVGPLDVSLSAGHRYTFVVMGQADEASHEALVIDETSAYQELGATVDDNAHITVNNLRGATGVTFELDGVVREDNVPYGEFRAAFWPAGTFTGLDLTLRDAEDEVLVSDATTEVMWVEAGDTIDCVGGVVGTVGGAWNNRTTPPTSTLPALEYLATFSSAEGSPYTFDTFLSAVRTAGLSDVLTGGGPHFILVPTDEAFAALPKDQFDALLADPEALADVLRYHIVEGYYPIGALGGEARRRKVLTNLLGMDLELGPGGNLGTNVGDIESAVVANGSRVGPITAVLMPPER